MNPKPRRNPPPNVKREVPLRILKTLFYAVAAAYPVLMFYFLVIRKIPLRSFSLVLIVFAFTAFITATSKKKRKNPELCF